MRSEPAWIDSTMSKRPPQPSSAARQERPADARVVAGVWSGGRTILIGLAVFLTVFMAFRPALRNGFVDWDDPDNFLKNQNFRGLGPAQLGWMFTTSHMGHYQPLSWITLACDYVWGGSVFGDGLDPRSYHLTNNLLHAANAVLVYLLALRLLGWAATTAPELRSWLLHAAAAAVALLFALHPLRVESVAWVTERRDVQSSFFLLLSVLCYLRAQRPGRSAYTGWLALAVLLHACSLLSRAMAVTLPVILLVLDWYPLGRFGRGRQRAGGGGLARILLEKVPFAVLALAASITAVWAQTAVKAALTLERHTVGARLAQLCYGLVFYVRKTLWPLELSPIYEMRVPIEVGAARYVVPIAAVLLVALTLAVLVVRGRGRAFVAAAACYGVLILPVSGLVQSGSQEVADRYSYVPSIVLMLLLGAGMLKLWRAPRVPRVARVGIGGVAGAVVLVLATLTWRQCAVWFSTATLWTHAVAIAPDSSIAQNGYGWVLLDQQKYDQALVHLRRALAIEPANEKAHHNIWTVLEAQERFDDLIQAYRDATRVLPNSAEAHYNLGVHLARRGDAVEAEREYRAALRLRPEYSQAHTNLANILRKRGDVTEARQHYERAVTSDPRNLIARRELAILLKEQNLDAEALQQIRAALALDPNDARSRQWLEKWTAAPGAVNP